MFVLTAAAAEKLKVITDEFNASMEANFKLMEANRKLMEATIEANNKAMMDTLNRTKLNKSTSVGTGQQVTATSVAATAYSPQDRVVQSSALAPTQLTPTSLPSDTPSDTTASGDRELGLDSAPAPLTLDPNSVVRIESVTTEEKTSTTEQNVTSMSSNVTQSLPSLVMPASSQVVITEASLLSPHLSLQISQPQCLV